MCNNMPTYLGETEITPVLKYIQGEEYNFYSYLTFTPKFLILNLHFSMHLPPIYVSVPC
jgi:hypothetical protein